MTEYTTLNLLLHDVMIAEGAAEFRECSKVVDDVILELAEQIKAKRATPPPPPAKEPLLVRFGDDVRITLWRGEQGKVLSRPLKGLYIYKTNEQSEMAAEKIEPRPGKDGYTWFMKNYGLNAEGEVAISSKTLEPHEGPILYRLLAAAKTQ